MSVQTNTRNSDLETFVGLLQNQQARKHDVVVDANTLRSIDGKLIVPEAIETMSLETGVGMSDLVLDPSAIADSGLAARMTIPTRYVRKLRDSSAAEIQAEEAFEDNDMIVAKPWTGLLDETLNTHFKQDSRRFLVRSFADENGHGIARAILSDKFHIIDNLDVLMAALEGVNQAGVKVEIQGCDLSERKMRVRVYCPDVVALAPELLKGYKTPWEDEVGGTGYGTEGLRDEAGYLPIVWGGFEISNSETGNGSFTITPRLVVKVCNNGMVITEDAMKRMHLGGKLDHGVVKFGIDTENTNLELIKKMTRDMVATFLDPEYVKAAVAKLEETASTQLEDIPGTLEVVGKKLSFSDQEQASILDCFIKGGQTTAGAVMHAVTAAAQRIEDPDRAAEFEATGIEAMTVAHRHAVSV